VGKEDTASLPEQAGAHRSEHEMDRAETLGLGPSFW